MPFYFNGRLIYSACLRYSLTRWVKQGRQLQDLSHLTKHYIRVYLCVSMQLRLQEGSQQVLQIKTEHVYLQSGCLSPPRQESITPHTQARHPSSTGANKRLWGVSDTLAVQSSRPKSDYLNLMMLATLRNLKAVIGPTWGRQSTPFDVPVSRQVCLAAEQHNTHPEGDEHEAPTCVCATSKTALMALAGCDVQAASCWFDSQGGKSSSCKWRVLKSTWKGKLILIKSN